MKAVLCASTLLALVCNVHATTFFVNKTQDTFDGVCDADCSLRDAIQAANVNAGEDVIRLQGTTYHISIPTTLQPVGEDDDIDPEVDEDDNQVGDLDIADDLKIIGRSGTRLDANYVYRVLEVLPGARVKLQDLEIRRGWVPEAGGGIANGGTLTLLRVRVAENRSASRYYFGKGGGIFNEGVLELRRSEIADNFVNGGEGSDARGAGLFNTGNLLMSDSMVRDNIAHDDGDSGAGAGLYNRGQATIRRSLFTGNVGEYHGHGGAILNVEGARLTLENTTISDNHSGMQGGGALANGERMDWEWEKPGEIHLTNVTVAENENGGLFNAGRATWINTLIASNYQGPLPNTRNYYAGTNCENHGQFQTTQVSVLLGNDGNCVGDILVDNGTVLNFVLYPLANNGGPTPTHALRPGPYAIDTSVARCPMHDQRGALRPVDGNGDGSAICDIGAFEHQPDDSL